MNSPPGGNKQLHGSYTWPHLHLFQYQEMEETWISVTVNKNAQNVQDPEMGCVSQQKVFIDVC